MPELPSEKDVRSLVLCEVRGESQEVDVLFLVLVSHVLFHQFVRKLDYASLVN